MVTPYCQCILLSEFTKASLSMGHDHIASIIKVATPGVIVGHSVLAGHIGVSRPWVHIHSVRIEDECARVDEVSVVLWRQAL